MPDRQTMEALLQRMRAMSAADISVLTASSETAGSSMTTSPGSANDRLWSEMVQLGWMLAADEELPLPGGAAFRMRVFTISAEGVQPIAHLLAACLGRTLPDAAPRED